MRLCFKQIKKAGYVAQCSLDSMLSNTLCLFLSLLFDYYIDIISAHWQEVHCNSGKILNKGEKTAAGRYQEFFCVCAGD